MYCFLYLQEIFFHALNLEICIGASIYIVYKFRFSLLCVEIRKQVLCRLLLSHESVLSFFISQVYSYDVRTELPVAAASLCLYT